MLELIFLTISLFIAILMCILRKDGYTFGDGLITITIAILTLLVGFVAPGIILNCWIYAIIAVCWLLFGLYIFYLGRD